MGTSPRAAVAAGPRFLMITHDQDIDRRIIQEAQSLVAEGWCGTIVCLSRDAQDHRGLEEGLDVDRIGLSKIVPDCPVYTKYNQHQQWLLRKFYDTPHRWLAGRRPLLGRAVNFQYKVLSKLNWLTYKLCLLSYYHNRRLACPLPFNRCFYEAASRHQGDVIIAHDLPALPAASRLACERGVPLVYDAHELYYEQKAFSGKQKKMMRAIEQELIVQCAAKFTVNQSIAEEMGRRYGCQAPNVLLNAVDPPPGFDVQARPKPFHKHFGLPDTTRVLLFQGGLLANRNLENLANAMAHLQCQDCVLVFMGNGPAKATLQAIAQKTGQSGRILFKEAVPQLDVINWTAGADMGIIPYPAVDLNTHFCTPNKLFEYVQAGLPILANDLPELRRFVSGMGLGRNVPMASPVEIAKGIDEALADPKSLQRWRDGLIARRTELSWQTAAKEYVRIVQSVLAAPREAAVLAPAETVR